MAQYGIVTLTGVSGSKYEFEAYSIDTRLHHDGVVYFITERSVNRGIVSHSHLYVGQTADLSDRFVDHHKQACFDRHGANCICIHKENDEGLRLKIERDLREQYDPPCNE